MCGNQVFVLRVGLLHVRAKRRLHVEWLVNQIQNGVLGMVKNVLLKHLRQMLV
jgi:hypothetical protein